jgi:hypothetical protein
MPGDTRLRRVAGPGRRAVRPMIIKRAQGPCSAPTIYCAQAFFFSKLSRRHDIKIFHHMLLKIPSL